MFRAASIFCIADIVNKGWFLTRYATMWTVALVLDSQAVSRKVI